MAYESNASGRDEVYVRPFVPPTPQASADKSAAAPQASPDESAVTRSAPADTSALSRDASADTLRLGSGQAAGGQWQVSTAGGVYPAWRHDGKELYYLNPAGAMMAVPITASGATLQPGAPVVLFPTRIYGGGVESQQRRQYDVGPDGRFLINMELESAAAPITLIQNWGPTRRSSARDMALIQHVGSVGPPSSRSVRGPVQL